MVFTSMIIHTYTQSSTAMMLIMMTMDYLYKVKMQHQLAIMIMTMIMIIQSYQSQPYSSDSNHTLCCIYNVMISGHASVTT